MGQVNAVDSLYITPSLPVSPVIKKTSVTMYFNVRSLLPKMDHLRATCCTSSPDVICVVESWLDHTIGYSIVRLDRSRHGGGVQIFVNNQFTCVPLYAATPEFQCLIVTIHNSAGPSPDFTVVQSGSASSRNRV